MKPAIPKWTTDNPLNVQVEAMFGRKRTKRGFGRYTAKEYRKALVVLNREKRKQVKKNEKKSTNKTRNSF